MTLGGLQLMSMPFHALSGPFGDDDDRVLVVVQCKGGNDGLNTVIPLDQYGHLFGYRPSLMIPEHKVLGITQETGLHPSMTGMLELYQEGKLSIVRGVGYPGQNRSHFRSTDIWTSASASDAYVGTGWLGRFLDEQHPAFPEQYPNRDHPDPFAIAIGNDISQTCQGQASNFSIALKDPFNLSPLFEAAPGEVEDSYYGRELARVRDAIAKTNAYSDRVTQAARKGANLSPLYPSDNKLAQALKHVALLIAGGLKTRVYVVGLGGFDTHANQVVENEPTQGDHAVLLRTLSDAIRAFQDDVQRLGIDHRVLGMTFSEFGRRIHGNGSLGSDHGTAAPLFLFGSCVRAGLTGHNPIISTGIDRKQGVPMQYDFRDVYGSVLHHWFRLPEPEVTRLLSPEFQPLDLIDPCLTGDIQLPQVYHPSQFELAPNPFRSELFVRFLSEGEFVRVGLFDSLGHEVRRLAARPFSKGYHELRLADLDGLPSGNYFVRLASRSQHQVKMVTRL